MSSRFFIETVKMNLKGLANCQVFQRHLITYAHWFVFGTSLETGGGMVKRELFNTAIERLSTGPSQPNEKPLL